MMKVTEFIDRLEQIIYLILVLILVLSSTFIAVYSPIEAYHLTQQGTDPIHAAFLVLKDLLLVMIMLEVLWLITDYLKTKTINVEPFIIIGIISAIRKILIVGAHPLESASEGKILLNMKEIILYTGVVLVLVIALFIVRWGKCLREGARAKSRNS